ncbi:DUF2062 domain-containing protein [Candidatus Woesearchaeota archaeon]|nr:DUF2062 domain-containing protein [Candidatus Woesearchaeota archaeon]
MKKRFLKWKQEMKLSIKKELNNEKYIHNIALGASVGTFISTIPTPGINILLALLISSILKIFGKSMSLWAVFASFAFWNPIVQFPIYIGSMTIGYLLFQRPFPQDLLSFEMIKNFSIQYFIGAFILALIISPLSYFLVIRILKLYNKRSDTTNYDKSFNTFTISKIKLLLFIIVITSLPLVSALNIGSQSSHKTYSDDSDILTTNNNINTKLSDVKNLLSYLNYFNTTKEKISSILNQDNNE